VFQFLLFSAAGAAHSSRVPSTDLTFASRDEHRAWLAAQAALPAGFRVGNARFEFTPREAPKPSRMTLTLLALDEPTPSFAAMFTRNAFPGAPIIVGRRRLMEPSVGAVIINNKISNVCAPGGVAAAESVCAAVARELKLAPSQVLPSSTGVIGWGLPLDAMLREVPAAAASLSSASILPAAEGIVTTDLYPKIRRASVGGGSIVGIAKGAGMIKPNMATMLGYLFTDAALPKEPHAFLRKRAADASFNCITIDGDTSTNDSFMLMATGAGELEVTDAHSPEGKALEAAITGLSQELAQMIVRDGEGATKFITVQIEQGRDVEECRKIAYAIGHSPLVKTAFFASDPNLGRILAAIGYAGVADLDVSKLDLYLDDVWVAKQGGRHPDYREEDGQRVMQQSEITVRVTLARGTASATIWTCDLSHEYVSINADYRS